MIGDSLLREFVDICKRDDLPGDELKWIADECGLETALKLALQFGGLQLYVPSSMRTAIKKKYARKKYDGSNARALALRLDVAERTIYRWVSKSGPSNYQISLFE